MNILPCKSNFGHFQNKDVLKAHVPQKLRTVKDVVRSMFKTPRFRKPFESQQASTSKTLLKFL